MNRLCEEIYAAFKRVNGYALGAIGIIVSLVPYMWDMNKTFSIKLLLPLGVILVITLVVLFDFSIHCFQRMTTKSPRVRRALPPQPLYQGTILTLLLDASDLFGTNAMVSIYRRHEEYEVLIGIGFVSTIQDNGLIQVCVQSSTDSDLTDIWEKIEQNNRDELARLIVKPTVPRNIVS